MDYQLSEPLSTDEQVEQTQGLLEFSTEISTLNKKTLLTTIAHTKGEAIMVSLDDLRILPGFNPRIRNHARNLHIRDIAESIKAHGFYADKPLAGIAGFEGKRHVIYLTDGDCRYNACQLAISEGALLEFVPLVLKDRTTTMEDLTIALVRSNGGLRFSTMELAIAAKRLFKFNKSIPKIAADLGFTPEYVSQLLTIAGAPHLIREMIESGEVPAAVAIQTLRAHGDDAVVVLQRAVVAAKASGRTGITRKHLPDQILKKAITKAAPTMVTAINRVKADPAFSALPDDVQEMIDNIISAIVAATPDAAETPPTVTETGEGAVPLLI